KPVGARASWREHEAWAGSILALSALLLASTLARMGCSYLFAIILLFVEAGLALDLALVAARGGFRRGTPAAAAVSPAAHLLALLPWPLVTTYSRTLLRLFVPLAGRMGAGAAPADTVAAVMAALPYAAALIGAAPVAARVSVRSLRRAAALAVVASVLVAAVFAVAWFPFDREHPRRTVIVLNRNATSGARTLDVFFVDPADQTPVLSALSAAVADEPASASHDAAAASRWTPMSNAMRDLRLGALYPVSVLCGGISFEADGLVRRHPAPETAKMLPPPPALRVISAEFDAALGIRTVVIECSHPDHH
ncbi:hypothetical protein HK405_000441, partial [Cladochytrium tenue]